MGKVSDATNRVRDLIGRRFGRWTAVAPCTTARRWLCRCDCGTERQVATSDLMAGKSSSCGCWSAERARKHGHAAGGRHSPEYVSWVKMRERCHDPRGVAYHRYGGRGIRVHAPWSGSFEAFLADVGPRPAPSYTLDRIDPNGHYEPGNVRWATRQQQSRNRANNHIVTALGRSMTIAEWSEQSGVNATAIGRRVAAGWPPDDAVTVPVGGAANAWRYRAR